MTMPAQESRPADHPGGTPPENDPVAQTMALLQPWIDYVPKPQRRLGLFIFLAFLVHIAVFFFIRIDTTRGQLQHQTRTHVTMEIHDMVAEETPSEDDFWDRLSDPRLFLLPQKSPANLSDEPALDFTSISSKIGAREFPAPARPEDYQFIHPIITPLGQRVGESMRPARQPFVYDETPPSIAVKTTWQMEAALARRQPAATPELPSPISDADLNPTVLRLAVNALGAVEHVMVEESSGRLDLDQQAILAARKIRFRAADHPGLLWGQATIFWRYSAKPREEVVPTPPTST